MFRLFRKNKKRPDAPYEEIRKESLRPSEQSGAESLDDRLERTRSQLGQKLIRLFADRTTIDADLFDEIETTLITGDINAQTAMAIVNNLRAAVKNKVIRDPAGLLPAVQAELYELI